VASNPGLRDLIEKVEALKHMRQSRVKRLSSFLLAALLCGPARAAAPPQPGTINYIEGQVSVDGRALADKAAGSVQLTAGQSLDTQDGRAEILLTPGIFFRAGHYTEAQMISPDLANTILMMQKGRALVEVADIRPESNVRINGNNASAQLLKPGLYDFDADRHVVRVFVGQAAIQGNGQRITLKSGRQISLNTVGKLKAQKFDKKAYQQDDFYRWASLRSSYLTEANVDAAGRYAGGGGWSPDVWAGAGWYWDPFFDAYTFIPGDGIFYSPFGWGFYSPWFVYGAPYFGYFGGYHQRFGSGYRPRYSPGAGARGFAGGAGVGSFGHGGFHGFGGGGGFRGGGFHGGGGFRGGGFHGGGGFRGGGFHGGGGSHGGAGGHR
jgi:hypothetical protein